MNVMRLQVQEGLERRRHARAPQRRDNGCDYLWCVVCEHAFPRECFRRDGAQLCCPDRQCEGGLMFQPWQWTRLREANPDYPAAPVADAVYPYFGQPESNQSRH